MGQHGGKIHIQKQIYRNTERFELQKKIVKAVNKGLGLAVTSDSVSGTFAQSVAESCSECILIDTSPSKRRRHHFIPLT